MVYASLHACKPKVRWNSLVWSSFHVPKTSFLSWMMCHNSLPTKDRVAKFREVENPLCELCGVVNETRDHLFFDCCYARQVLQRVMRDMGLEGI